MTSKVWSVGLFGVDGVLVEVEVDVQMRVPAFEIVGMPDAAVREARERVRSAIENSGFEFPRRRVVVNMAPASMKKEGSGFDLAIAVGILSLSGVIDVSDFSDSVFVGELSLEGDVKPVKGILPIVSTARKCGFKRVYLPCQNALEGSVVKGVEVYPVKNLTELVMHLNGEVEIEAMRCEDVKGVNAYSDVDFSDVKGHAVAKRVMEIVAAGGHNVLLFGPPGGGKTMLARRLPTILPPMTFEEMIETTKIYSAAGLTSDDSPLIKKRPFRSPHHSSSEAAVVGGGKGIPRPGEVSLAHNGVLFLDELQEFKSSTLQAIREPLEEGVITISRSEGSVKFPADFILVASLNPNRGMSYNRNDNYFNPRILKKISGPLIDRIDIHFEVFPVDYDEFVSGVSETSARIRERVVKAREIQKERFKGLAVKNNAKMSHRLVEKFCPMTKDAKAVMRLAFRKVLSTARGYDKVLKVARTIADLEGEEVIKEHHIAEAVQYRVLDRMFRYVS